MVPDRSGYRRSVGNLRRARATAGGLGLLFCGAFGVIADEMVSAGRPPDRVATLVPGQAVEQSLSGGQSHLYQVMLAADRYFRLEVEQRGVDIVVALDSPEGRRVAEIDSPSGRQGVEVLSVIAESPGRYRIEIHAPPSQAPGLYRAAIAALRPPTEDDRTRVAAERTLAHGEALRRQGDRALLPRAIEHYREAHRLWSRLGDQAGQAEAFDRIGRIYQRFGEPDRASAAYQQALDLFAALNDHRSQAGLLLRLGKIYGRIGKSESAVASYRQAQKLALAAGDRSRQAYALNNLAVAAKRQGQIHQALETYKQALVLWRDLDETAQQAQTLNNVGELYLALGSHQQAVDAFLEARSLRRQAGDRRGEAITLNSLGSAYLKLHRPELALGAFQQSLQLCRDIGDERGETDAQSYLGSAYFHLRQLARSTEAYEIAAERFSARQDRLNLAATRANLGRTLEASGRLEEASRQLEEALRWFSELREPRGQATALFGIARIRRHRGETLAALAASEAALERVESIRTEVTGSGLRSAWIAERRDYYELHTDLLMELHRQQPEAGFDARAFESAQRRWARSLLDALAWQREDTSSESHSGRQALQERLNAREQERLRLLQDGAPAPVVAAVERELRALVTELGNATPEHRRIEGSLPDVRQIRATLLHGETALLAYSLGTERSFLWLLTESSISSHILPGRLEIEARARRAYDLLTGDDLRQGRIPAQLATRSLSDVLLAPVAGELGTKRLLVVRDGMLHYLPWNVLPDPRQQQSWQPMIERHEIVHLPSTSVLDALERRELEVPDGSVAVFADPVFSLQDPRICPANGSADGACPEDERGEPVPKGDLWRAARELGLLSFERLPFSRQEADAILERAPGGKTLAALGLAAHREHVLGGQLAGYRIVHFATHGLIHDRHPELSGLVLSLFDGEGRPREGFLRAHEIQRLNLSAELVVLSACRTALGPRVWGEGLVGLPQAFLIAGAQRVLVSLWRVRDQATAELMKRFYDRLLVGAQPPAAALRAAQRSMRAESRWQDPQHWAGFLLLGAR